MWNIWKSQHIFHDLVIILFQSILMVKYAIIIFHAVKNWRCFVKKQNNMLCICYTHLTHTNAFMWFMSTAPIACIHINIKIIKISRIILSIEIKTDRYNRIYILYTTTVKMVFNNFAVLQIPMRRVWYGSQFIKANIKWTYIIIIIVIIVKTPDCKGPFIFVHQ